ncbi:SDR family oxidoreductase [Kordiimonas pumila]|uniref:SDR family oxidoreductase n=1 Tax=Kordiimonas pumila TaxID=2161677 RepID=A0ABV7D9N3_9PROT|nr:SDR family oxidoreductase [Kordiimonas pumila]
MPKQLLVFGPGYSAVPVMTQAQENGWLVTGTYRSDETRQMLEKQGFKAIDFTSGRLPTRDGPLHILITAAPTREGADPVLSVWEKALLNSENIKTICYLSSTNVYGDHSGDWVTEETMPNPSLERGTRRLEAEKSWEKLAKNIKASCFIFRLAGIYGPGRNAIQSLKTGKAKSILKPGQVFSRIHVTDITAALWAAITGPYKGGIYNLADDLPCPPHEVIAEAARLMGVPAPVLENWETADLSPMARSFYTENKRVDNTKIKQELGLDLKYPDYKSGLKALIETE